LSLRNIFLVSVELIWLFIGTFSFTLCLPAPAIEAECSDRVMGTNANKW